MRSLRAARAHCDNFQTDGSCLGIRIRDDFSLYRFRKEGLRCLLADRERCPHFEEIVVPMRMSYETPQATLRAKAKEAAVSAYLKLHKLIPQKIEAKRVCRECRRIEVNGNQVFCYKCAQKRHRSSKCRSARTKRQSNVDKVPDSPIQTEALTNPDQSDRYSSSGHSHFDDLTAVTGDAAFAKLRELQ
jgi:hypothetical protein